MQKNAQICTSQPLKTWGPSFRLVSLRGREVVYVGTLGLSNSLCAHLQLKDRFMSSMISLNHLFAAPYRSMSILLSDIISADQAITSTCPGGELQLDGMRWSTYWVSMVPWMDNSDGRAWRKRQFRSRQYAMRYIEHDACLCFLLM